MSHDLKLHRSGKGRERPRRFVGGVMIPATFVARVRAGAVVASAALACYLEASEPLPSFASQLLTRKQARVP